jgi:hypothetical protein
MHHCSSYKNLIGVVQEMFPLHRPVAASDRCVGARYGKPLPTEAAFVESTFWGRSVLALSAEDLAAAARATGEAVRAARRRGGGGAEALVKERR